MISLLEVCADSPRADQSVWPWQAEPYKLWSLLDMMRFQSGVFSACMAEVLRLSSLIASVEMVGSPLATKETWDRLITALADLRDELAPLPFSFSLQEQLARAVKQCSAEHTRTTEMGAVLAREAYNNTLVELSSFYCLAIPAHRRLLFEGTDLFGEPASEAFPEAVRDVSAAGRCIALMEWTAVVFHCMRVLEHGLRPVAARFDVPFATDSWHKVLIGIEAGLNGLRNKSGLTEFDRREIAYYSDAASQFRHFKDAWRNHVSHGRDHYDEREALKVWNHVKAFMSHLALRP